MAVLMFALAEAADLVYYFVFASIDKREERKLS